jgi:hypothetical protein
MVKKNNSHVYEHKEHKSNRHNAHINEHKKKTDYGKIVFFSILGLVVIVFASQFLFSGGTKETTINQPTSPSGDLSGLDEFANCLTENDVVFYGTKTCPACSQQRGTFGDSLEYVNYVECDKNAQTSNLCSRENIRVVPTWKFNGVPKEGVMTLEQLARESGCSL